MVIALDLSQGADGKQHGVGVGDSGEKFALFAGEQGIDDCAGLEDNIVVFVASR